MKYLLVSTDIFLEVEMYFKAKDEKSIYYKKWNNVEKPRAVLHIVHGMCEHINRYDDFAKFLNQNKIVVYGMDTRGHGRTVTQNERFGDFGEEVDWEDILEDIETLMTTEKKNYNLPFFILGHSMGSFMVRHFIQITNQKLNGAIIVGTGNSDDMRYTLVRFILKFLKQKKDSKFVHGLAFGSNNSKIINPKTKLDWLSTDENEVQKYISDKYCGFNVTNRFYKVFLNGLKKLTIAENEFKLDKKVPLLFIAGESDPVGNMGKYISEIVQKYQDKGCSNLDSIIYPGMRHEIINDVNKSKVYEDIQEFILSNIN